MKYIFLNFVKSRMGKSNGFSVSDISSVAGSAGRIPQIPYEELQKSTNNWDPLTMLGRGGFGIVFKGTYLRSAVRSWTVLFGVSRLGVWKCTQVAIKRIEQKQDNPDSHNEQIRQSINELHCLNAYRHDNVLPVYG